MCRACYAVVIAEPGEQARIRRAAGLDVQVTAVMATFEEIVQTEPAPDVVILLGPVETPAIKGPALVVIGEETPSWADAAIPDGSDLADRLPGAIVRALIARRSRA